MIKTLHVVEDGDHLRPMLMALPALGDTRIAGYRSAEHFLGTLDDHGSGVLLLDGRLQGMSGIELLSVLQDGDRAFAPILLSAQNDVAMAVSAMKAGAVDFMIKPCEPHRLVDSIVAAFDHLAEHRADRAVVATARGLIGSLSPRERSVLGGLIRGGSNKSIAHELDLSPRTVEIHRANLMHKLGVRRLSEALRMVFAARMIDELWDDDRPDALSEQMHRLACRTQAPRQLAGSGGRTGL